MVRSLKADLPKTLSEREQMENTISLMEINMKVNGQMINVVVKENYTLQMEVNLMAYSRKMKSMMGNLRIRMTTCLKMK